MSEKTVRYVMRDKLFTYSYRTGTPNGPILGNHMHIYYEFLQLIDGRALYNVEGKEYEVLPGDLMITNPYEFHFITFPKKSVYERQFLQIRSDFVEDLRPDILSVLNARKFGENNRIPAEIFNKYGLGHIFRGIEEYTSAPSENTDFMVRTYAAQLVVKLSEIMRNEFLINKQNGNKNIRQIYQYIEANFTSNITMDELAAYVHLEKSYVSRLFKKETGITITEYINMRRIILAKNMLLSGRNPNDIYWTCGFKEYSTFFRAFKKYVGSSPETFRKENNN